MESHTKYQETVYLRSADGSALWVNLYIPSTLDWAERGFTIKQETQFPREGSSKLTITGDGHLDLKLRVPGWIRKGFNVSINGEEQPVEVARPSTYLSLDRTWRTGDVVEVQMPLSIRTERALDRPDTQALMWGPVLLQTVGQPTDGDYWKLSLYRGLKLDGDYKRAAVEQKSTTSNGDPVFAALSSTNTGLTIQPYYISDTQPVSTYFRRLEPNVVFGNVDTNIPNRKRNDGLPRYDVPVANITSPGTDGPTFLDVVWDQAPFSTHSDFLKVVSSVADTFVAAKTFTLTERDTIVKKAGEAEKELAL